VAVGPAGAGEVGKGVDVRVGGTAVLLAATEEPGVRPAPGWNHPRLAENVPTQSTLRSRSPPTSRSLAAHLGRGAFGAIGREGFLEEGSCLRSASGRSRRGGGNRT
jgi:hypothetical protein